MNESTRHFDLTDEDDLQRALDRLADGERSPAEEEALFLHLDETPCGWKLCATTLLEAQDLRRALAGVALEMDAAGESRAVSLTYEASTPVAQFQAVGRGLPATRPYGSLAWYGSAAIVAGIAFFAGFALAQRSATEPSLADRDGTVDRTTEKATDPDTAEVPNSAPRPDAGDGPEIVNVVYRSGDESRSAPLPVYSSNDAWAREVDAALRKSAADLAQRREKLLAQGRDVERQVVLQPVVTGDGKQMLIPVETFQIVPVSLSSFH